MPKVHHVKRARKDNPVAKKGEPYYWWQFAFGPKQYSKTPPKRSQLTQSSFLSQLYDLQDGMQERLQNVSLDTIQDVVTDLVDELQAMLDECQDSLDNMPEHLQEASSSGELLQERIDNLESWITDLENIDLEPDEDLTEEEKEDWLQDRIDEISSSDQYF